MHSKFVHVCAALVVCFPAVAVGQAVIAPPAPFAATSYTTLNYDTDQAIVEQWLAPWRERCTVMRTDEPRLQPQTSPNAMELPDGTLDFHVAASRVDIAHQTWVPLTTEGPTNISTTATGSFDSTVGIHLVEDTIEYWPEEPTRPRFIHSTHRTTSTLGYHRQNFLTEGVYEYDRNGLLRAFYQTVAPSDSVGGRPGPPTETLAFPVYNGASAIIGWSSWDTTPQSDRIMEVTEPTDFRSAQYQRRVHLGE